MIAYANLGTNDLEKAKSFYDAILAPLGAKVLFNTDRAYFYGSGSGPMLTINKPFDGQPATFGNGTMIALDAPSQDAVNEIHAKALELGGKDEGAPGLRGDTYYGAYFRDLDGNKFVVCHWPR
ncbi:MAG TPA: VOC family protein [Pedomonas sp.]|uniref:VOC family protein n=1 Tax=Pedomonas sp. TaxID=2976421 RepID=UPI002F42C2C6